jgi:hypothetical protein
MNVFTLIEPCLTFEQTRPEGVAESLGGAEVQLSSEDLEQIRKIVNSADVMGGRYNAHAQASLNR